MAATGSVSTQFVIAGYLTTPAGAFTIANPGRSFRVVGLEAYNAGGTPAITLADGAGNTIATGNTVTNGWVKLPMTLANAEILSNENLVLTNAANTTSFVIIRCMAEAGGTALTVT